MTENDDNFWMTQKQDVYYVYFLVVVYFLTLSDCFIFRLVVGAPVADSSFYPNVEKPGAIYKCHVSTKKCQQLQSGGFNSINNRHLERIKKTL